MSAWDSKSKDKSGSGNFNPPMPNVDTSRPDPTGGKTGTVASSVRNGSAGVWSPGGAGAEKASDGGVSVPKGNYPSANVDVHPRQSQDRTGSNTNVSK